MTARKDGHLVRVGEEVSRQPHKLEIDGSSPSPATTKIKEKVMSTMVGVNLCEDNFVIALKNACSLDLPIQLFVDSKEAWLKRIDEIADILSQHNRNIVSLRGPFVASDGNTLFEDTTFVATQLEDLFNVELKSITAFINNGWKPIVELVEFYRETIKINVAQVARHGYIGTRSPVDMVAAIEGQPQLRGIKMSFDSLNLSGVWLHEEILYSLSTWIAEHCFDFETTQLTPQNVSNRLLFTKHLAMDEEIDIVFYPHKHRLHEVPKYIQLL